MLQVYMLHGMGVQTGTNLDKLIEVAGKLNFTSVCEMWRCSDLALQAGSYISSHLGRETMSR